MEESMLTVLICQSDVATTQYFYICTYISTNLNRIINIENISKRQIYLRAFVFVCVYCIQFFTNTSSN